MSKRSKPSGNVGLVSVHASDPLAQRYIERLISHSQKFRVVELNQVTPGGRLPKNVRLQIVCGAIRDLRRFLAREHPGKDCEVLFVGRCRDKTEEFSTLRVGVQGIVCYEDVDRCLIKALSALVEGRIWLTKNVEQQPRQMSISCNSEGLVHPRFTTRQAEIAKLIEEGFSNKQISDEIGISERTVKFHVQNIFTRLGINDRRKVRGCSALDESNEIN